MAYIKVRAVTGSKLEKIEKKSDDHYVISVKEKAEMNLANKRIITILKDLFGKNNVRLISGHHSPSKIFSVE